MNSTTTEMLIFKIFDLRLHLIAKAKFQPKQIIVNLTLKQGFASKSIACFTKSVTRRKSNENERISRSTFYHSIPRHFMLSCREQKLT